MSHDAGDLHPDIMKGLTLVRVNGEELGTQKKNLKKLQVFLRSIEDGVPTRWVLEVLPP